MDTGRNYAVRPAQQRTNAHPVPTAYPKPTNPLPLYLRTRLDVLGDERGRGRISGAPLGRLRLDPARADRGGLECSDLSPLTRESTPGNSVRSEPRGFQAVVVCEEKNCTLASALYLSGNGRYQGGASNQCHCRVLNI